MPNQTNCVDPQPDLVTYTWGFEMLCVALQGAQLSYLLCQVYELSVTLALNKHPQVALGGNFDPNPSPLTQVKNRFLSLIGRYLIYTK